MQDEITPKPRKVRSVVTSASALTAPQRHHISDSQFQFSYDFMPAEIRNRPLTVPAPVPVQAPVSVPAQAQMDEVRQSIKLKRSQSRRPDGNPVTGEGYEPRHYRPCYYGPLKVITGDAQAQEVELPSRNSIAVTTISQDDSSPLLFNSAPLSLQASTQRPLSATMGRKRVPPGGFSNGLW